MAGQKWGRWTVISRAPNCPRGQARWLCQCECGERRVVAGGTLRNGTSQSCGCFHREVLSKQAASLKPLIGMRFHRLVVTAYDSASYGKVARWFCQCDCGNVKSINGSCLRLGVSKSCGCLRREKAGQRSGPNSPNWRAAKYTDVHGYVSITHNKQRVKEHRVVMEKFLGRSLYADETVHHKNGVRSDNRIENLELKATAHGRGQTATDLVAWARECLQRYAPQQTPDPLHCP